MVAPVGAIEKAAQILSSFDTKKIEQNLSASLRKNVISFFPSYIVYYTLYGLSIIFFLYYRSEVYRFKAWLMRYEEGESFCIIICTGSCYYNFICHGNSK
jgi:hypothetical protein